MFSSYQLLGKTLDAVEARVSDRFEDLNSVFVLLDKYCTSVFASDAKEKKGEDLSVPLEAALNISITLLKMIDSGSTGPDDRIAEELTKIRDKYFGR
ncbi:MAG TPA: hypothetical protein PKJ16_14990 [Spirochaetota bacterium]|nr:hypothetical protein [Spirochaetota bacterium]HOS40429.1 hypothetical protein [Spirochaetota bacterium]HPU89077.1 hypothetical protein [Spirochaetota bacterium]